MDKLKTKILLISLLLLVVLSVHSVAAAADGDGNLTSESIDLSICDNTGDVSSDKLSNSSEDVLSASNEPDVLGADEASFSQLESEILHGGKTVELQHSYYKAEVSDSIIVIEGGNRIIDGRGAVIDMAGSDIRAFYVECSGVTIKNLTIKNVNTNYDGGAIYFLESGTVENCNFTNNTSNGKGGAVYFFRNGGVKNSSFTNNTANIYGGAVYFDGGSDGRTINCNFTNNKASNNGGAVYFLDGGDVTNCSFTNNTATHGGGAINMGAGTVTNCNFTGNNATTGSAIYFYSTSDTKTVSNSRFLNNRANAEALVVTKNDNNITITFTGKDNLLNAIYSNGDVTFTNVAYWSADGIAKTGSSAIKPSRSNREAGQNITLEIFDSDDRLVDNVTLVTDDNGQVSYDLSKLSRGKYLYNAYHLDDSYYTYAQKNDTFTVVVGDFNLLQRYINGASSVLSLDRNYTFTIGLDENLTDGIVIDKPITINGNGYTINALQKAKIFDVTSLNVVLNNITFANANASDNGGAVSFSIEVTGVSICEGTVENCSFTDNHADGKGGAVYFRSGTGIVKNCNFTYNAAFNHGGAIYFWHGEIENCSFADNRVTGDKIGAGAVYFDGGKATNCIFTNNSASYGGAILFVSGASVTNCNFTNNTASLDGGAIRFSSSYTVTGCNFIGNNATNGSAIYSTQRKTTKNILNSLFLNNRANAKDLQVSKNENNITIVFSGNDNLLNALFSDNVEIYFTNVTYWGAKGINNTGLSVISLPRSDNESGQNITLEIYDSNGSLVDNVTLVTDDNGQAVYDFTKLSRGKYRYNAYHLDDSYYTYTEKSDEFTIDLGDFNLLQRYINGASSVLSLDRNYTFTIGLDENLTEGIVIDKPITINGNGFTINAMQKARIFNVTSGSVVLNNITFANATAYNAGAIYFYDNSIGELTNCYFTDNKASGYGGAIYFDYGSTGSVINCNFTNNAATNGDGGAVFFYDDAGNVTNCTFTNNAATNGDGGAVYFVESGDVTNCNFTNNKATDDCSYGGAVCFNDEGNVTNCTFTNNSASLGGAIYFISSGTTHEVTNCNFVDNKATSYDGGAIYFSSTGTVKNCNFTNNTASDWGGAILFAGTGNVTNCNFTGNKATGKDSYGGAVYFLDTGEVTNCNFTDNTASYWGGAIYFGDDGTVTNCIFTGNNATTGSAIYFYWESATKTVSNSRFLNNRANAETLELTKNDNNITIIFTGNDNLLNAIYSNGDVKFTNVAYWGANVIANTGSSPTTPARSNKEAGQNITVSVVVNDILVLNKVITTDENGMIVLDIIAGENYYISARHDTDSYYTESETINSTMKFNVNVTSQTTNNKTVNITAKSNIYNEFMPGKLLFIVPNTNPINATYAGNGTWWAVHTFDDYGVYEVNASFIGLDNVTVNNGTVTIAKANSTICAENKTVAYPGDVVLRTSGENCTGINKSSVVVRSHDGTVADADVTVDGFIMTISGLGAGNYTVYYNNTVDYDWNGAGNFTGITVLKAKSSVSASDVEVTYGEAIAVAVSCENATEVSYQIIGADGVVKEGCVDAGENITGLDLAAGEYAVNLTTVVNGNYTASDYTSKITVKPANSSVKAEDVNVVYGDSIVVAVSCENATEVSYQIIGADGVVKEGCVDAGENITGLDLGAGKYAVNLTAMVNGNYTSSNYTSRITVKPAGSTISAADVEVTYGETVSIQVSVVNASEFYYAIVNENGETVDSDIIESGLNITVENLSAGRYDVTLITGVDSNHTSARNASKITVSPAGSSVSACDVEVTYGEAIVVVVSSVNATEVSYQIIGDEGVVKEGSVDVGENITGLDLAVGEYAVNLTTVVSSNYTADNFTSRITVSPAGSSVSASDVEVTYGDSIVVVISSENATKVSYQIIGADGVVKEGSVDAGENITGLDLAAGEYAVNLTALVNANHTASNFTSKITVSRADSSISAFDVELTYGEAVVIPVSVVNASEFYYAIVNENGTIVDSDIVQSGLNITVENLSAGRFNVTLITGVDSNHTSARNASGITVSPAGSSVSAEDAASSFGEAVSIPVSSANATEVSYTITDAKGIAVANGTVKSGEPISVSSLAAGNYTVGLMTVVDANHTSASSSSKLHIRHVVSIAIAPLTGYVDEEVSITVEFRYENGDPAGEGVAALTIRYDEREVLSASEYSILTADETVPVSNGKATFNVKIDAPGTYPYVVSYSGPDADDIQAESTITILKANTTVSGVDVSGKPDDRKDVTVTVTDQDNNPVSNGTVTLTLDGKTYNAIVDNGKAVITVELPNPGEYNASVTYNGNGYYAASTSSIAFDVEKENTKVPSAEDVSGKAGEKTDIKVSFVDESGNPVKNGTATLTIDGKTYTAEVINGVATFKGVAIPLKDTVADVYYHGNDYYNASSTSFSIKIQNNNTEPDDNNTDENRTVKRVSSKVADANATGNPVAVMLLALFVMVITYRKR